MLLYEILCEAYDTDRDSFVLDLVTSYQANGLREIPLDTIIAELNKAGFQIDKNYLVQFFGDPKKSEMGIQVIPEQNKILLKDTMHDEQHAEKSVNDQNKVKDMAQQQAAKGAK